MMGRSADFEINNSITIIINKNKFFDSTIAIIPDICLKVIEIYIFFMKLFVC